MLSTAERFSPEWWHAMGQQKDQAASTRDESAGAAAAMETGERHTDHGPVAPPRNRPRGQ